MPLDQPRWVHRIMRLTNAAGDGIGLMANLIKRFESFRNDCCEGLGIERLSEFVLVMLAGSMAAPGYKPIPA